MGPLLPKNGLPACQPADREMGCRLIEGTPALISPNNATTRHRSQLAERRGNGNNTQWEHAYF